MSRVTGHGHSIDARYDSTESGDVTRAEVMTRAIGRTGAMIRGIRHTFGASHWIRHDFRGLAYYISVLKILYKSLPFSKTTELRH